MKKTPKANTADVFQYVYLFVSKINPVKIIACYALMTVLFSFVYWFLPSGSFYAPYTQFEPAALEDKAAFGLAIADAVRRQMTPSDDADYISGPNGRQIALKNISVKDVRATSQTDIRLQLWFVTRAPIPATKDAGAGVNTSLQRLNVILQFGRLFPQRMPNSWHTILLADPSAPSQNERDQAEVYYSLLFANQNTRQLILLSRSDEDRAHEILEGYAGNPSADSHSYFRLLYFSIVVVTTLGLGDIVPMTPAARFFVGMESFFGVIMAGLFLNAVFASASNSELREAAHNSNPCEADGSVTQHSEIPTTAPSIGKKRPR